MKINCLVVLYVFYRKIVIDFVYNKGWNLGKNVFFYREDNFIVLYDVKNDLIKILF